MTSYTRKLYNTDPAAAEAFRRAHEFERQMVYGKAVTLACFSPAHNGLVPAFGRRLPTTQQHGCDHHCRHVACARGCTLRRE